MEKNIIYKVPGGKLLKIFLVIDRTDRIIENICITGDFFAYPEESIEVLERTLKQKPLNKQKLFDTIESFIQTHHIQFIGVDAMSLTDAIMRGIA